MKKLHRMLEGDDWTHKIARIVFPLLVKCAQAGENIEYGEINSFLVKNRLSHSALPIAYRHVAGAIGDTLESLGNEYGMNIPPINILVVQKRTGQPGPGCDPYIQRFVAATGGRKRKVESDERAAIVEDTTNEVYAYGEWNKILKMCGLPILDYKVCVKDRKIGIAKGRWATGDESEDHKNLKKYCSNNPDLVGLPKQCPNGKQEYEFLSSDRVDVLFCHNTKMIAVEVKTKNASDKEMERGIYQCVKYRALLRAEQRHRRLPMNGSSILVVGRELSSDQLRLADLFGVEVVFVRI